MAFLLPWRRRGSSLRTRKRWDGGEGRRACGTSSGKQARGRLASPARRASSCMLWTDSRTRRGKRVRACVQQPPPMPLFTVNRWRCTRCGRHRSTRDVAYAGHSRAPTATTPTLPSSSPNYANLGRKTSATYTLVLFALEWHYAQTRQFAAYL